MDINPNTLFSIFFILLIAGLFYSLFRRRQASDEDGKLSILEYGQLLLQADQTARIIVRGVQEEWRNGTIADEERTHEAVKQLKALYPLIDESELIRIVKSAVYLLRLGAGKTVDRVMEHVPDELPTLNIQTSDNLGITPHVQPFTLGSGVLSKNTWESHYDPGLAIRLDGDMRSITSGSIVYNNLPG